MAVKGSATMARHLARIMGGFASSSVTIGGVTGGGVFAEESVEDTDRAGMPVLRRERVLLLQVDAWPDVRPQQTATVDDVDYTITSLEKVHGGAAYHARLRRAN